MAGKKKAAPAAKGKAQGPKGKGGSGTLLLVIGIALVPFSLPTLALLFFGMLPTLAAALVDRSPFRYAWLCVGGLNFSGVANYLFDLWFKGQTMVRAVDTLTDVTALMVMYSTAALGWLLYLAMPPVVGAFMAVAAQRRVSVLRGQQKKLIELWGDDVAEKAQAAPAQMQEAG